MSVEDIVDGLAHIQNKRGRIVDQGDVEMLALAIKELRKGRPGRRAEGGTTGVLVPPEPTQHMYSAFSVAWLNTQRVKPPVKFAAAYKAMLEAAQRESSNG